MRIGAARTSLLTSTALSATYPTSVKLLYAADGAPLTPPLITAVRFTLMAMGAQASGLLRTEDTGERSGFWLAAAELGVWATAGAQLNTAALQQIDVVRGTIILACINLLTPALSMLIGTSEAQRTVTARTWVACVLAALFAIIALSDGASAAPISDLAARQHGDGLALGAALCFATQQVRLGSLVSAHNPQRLAAARLQTQAACSLVLLPLAGGTQENAGSAVMVDELSALAARSGEWISALSGTQAGLLCFSACTAVIGLLLQFQGQRYVTAASAQPIYAASPILAAVWARLVLAEPITANECLGGLGISGAAVLACTSKMGVQEGSKK